MINFAEAFKQAGTDKFVHEYHHYYEKVIDKSQVNSLLEIGVAYGHSLRAWRLVWPDALIEGMEVTNISEETKDNFNVYKLSSININEARLINKTYDMIVDDGDHHWQSQLLTFYNFYPKANKYYIIEDMLGEYGQNKLLENLPKEVLAKSYVYDSLGPKRTFVHSKNIEKDASHKILLIVK